MKLTKVILSLCTIAILGCQSDKKENSTQKLSDNKRPNIVVILADDLGYADVGYNGCKDIPTPNIDALAKSGVIFSNGYVTAAVCSPTRAALITGRYQQRFGSEFIPGGRLKTKDAKEGVPLTETFISTRLKKLGYATACFGKWHLGGESGDQDLFPLNRGFDEFFGFLEGAALYIDPQNKEKKYMRSNDIITMEEAYYTDAITRESVSFIERNKDKPFFLYVPYNAVHAPLQATDEYLKLFDTIKNPKRRLLAAMNFAMDKGIGEITKTLQKNNLEENTLIFFLSDNGGKPDDNYSSNLPLRGEKTQYYEGGIRVPFALKWKNHFPENMVYDKPVSALDIVPTIFAAIGEDIETSWDLEGVDLTPYLLGKDMTHPHETLFWKAGEKFAARNEEWKIVKNSDKIELFNILNDPYETIDLASKYPKQLEILLKAYKDWDSKNIPAQYGYDKNLFPFEVVRTRRTELRR